MIAFVDMRCTVRWWTEWVCGPMRGFRPCWLLQRGATSNSGWSSAYLMWPICCAILDVAICCNVRRGLSPASPRGGRWP
eukprot:2444749-Pyramimonas_sp.AAC.1